MEIDLIIDTLGRNKLKLMCDVASSVLCLPVTDLGIATSDLEPVIDAVNPWFATQAGKSDFVIDFGCRRIVMRHIQDDPLLPLGEQKAVIKKFGNEMTIGNLP